MNRADIEKKFFYLSIFITLAALLICSFAGIIRHGYWSYVIYEKSPFGWYEAMLLFICFMFALCNLFFYYRKEHKINAVWLILSAGFLYLTLDEKFAIHESLREDFFKPNDIELNIFFWAEKGDYVLLILMTAGLLIFPFVFKELKKDKRALKLFITAVIFSIAAVMADSVSLSALSVNIQKLLQYAEEIFEVSAIIFFMNSFFSFLLKQLQK